MVKLYLIHHHWIRHSLIPKRSNIYNIATRSKKNDKKLFGKGDNLDLGILVNLVTYYLTLSERFLFNYPNLFECPFLDTALSGRFLQLCGYRL